METAGEGKLVRRSYKEMDGYSAYAGTNLVFVVLASISK